ncbi:MAG TPA: diaminopimelate epimerase [Thermoanaerobaculia bacterium]|jgi:diaminopimelate epimerase|nr:diaminopimelate epimerase [Thermoanaerobaculia bacterium]
MTHFYKVSGSGNDFLALAEPFRVPPPETIRAWCRRGVSLGADGLFVLRRAGGGATMDYFNADGFPADLCLNGTRCAAQLAFHLGWAQETVTVRTAAGEFPARQIDTSRVAVDLPVPAGPPESLTVEAGGASREGYRLTVGVPHFVLLWPEGLERAPVRELGAEIRRHPAFGAPGTNVNFVRFPAPDRMEIRTFERGVEDETLSCGTGALASAAVGLAAGRARAQLPLHVTTQGGFELEVAGDLSQGRWSLAGDARVIAEGDMLPGALASPEPPEWVRKGSGLPGA